MRILLIEPYDTGSHRAWARGLAAHSQHEIRIFALPGRFWKWRMHGAALTAARELREADWEPELILASDMLDLASFLGITRDWLAKVPVVLYMHENQLAYPAAAIQPGWSDSRRRRAARRDEHYAFVNLSSALAADEVWWNSCHNRDSFLGALPDFLRRFPDFRELEATGVVAQRSRVLPIGLDLATMDRARPVERETGPPRILWNHRWEHDKAPERFFAAIDMLVSRGLDFELVLLGESFVRLPEVLEAARDRLGDRIRHFGFVADRAAYARWLWQSDLVVSTARHEFFGTAVCEAAYCGCLALVPRQLAYPEIFAGAQARWLYDADGFQDRLADELQALAERPLLVRDESLRDAMGRFAWPIVVADYDAAFSELLRQGRPPRVLY